MLPTGALGIVNRPFASVNVERLPALNAGRGIGDRLIGVVQHNPVMMVFAGLLGVLPEDRKTEAIRPAP